MFHKFLIALFFTIATVSCKTPEAREPVQRSSGTFYEASAKRNKEIFETEKQQILAIIEKNSQNSYISSDSGFWYFYNTQDSLQSKMPQLGDEVTFTYNIKKLDGTIVLSESENGLESYRIDQNNQELVSGLRDGIKLMKEGETVTFLLPSYKAYGYYGIEGKLGTNVPIQSTVTLKSIEQTPEN